MSFFPFLFIPHVGCKTPSLGKIYSFGRYVLIREHHWIVFSSRIFRLGSFFIHIFYSLIFSSTFPYLNTLKTTFLPSIKGFQSSKEVWKRLIGSFYSHIHLLPLIDHFRFLNLKTPIIFLKFQPFNLPPYGFDLDWPLF